MANRHIIAVNKLDDFKAWLVTDGWQIQEPKGDYEVLRATKNGRKHPLLVYYRHDTNGGKQLVHYTVADRDMSVAIAYCKQDTRKFVNEENRKLREYIDKKFADIREKLEGDTK